MYVDRDMLPLAGKAVMKSRNGQPYGQQYLYSPERLSVPGWFSDIATRMQMRPNPLSTIS